MGLDGELRDDIYYKFLYTYSRNYGIISDQIIGPRPRSECPPIENTICAELRPLNQLKKINHSIFSSLEIQSKYDRFNYGFSISTDIGDLYDKAIGISIFLNYKISHTKVSKQS